MYFPPKWYYYALILFSVFICILRIWDVLSTTDFNSFTYYLHCALCCQSKVPKNWPLTSYTQLGNIVMCNTFHPYLLELLSAILLIWELVVWNAQINTLLLIDLFQRKQTSWPFTLGMTFNLYIIKQAMKLYMYLSIPAISLRHQ